MNEKMVLEVRISGGGKSQVGAVNGSKKNPDAFSNNQMRNNNPIEASAARVAPNEMATSVKFCLESTFLFFKKYLLINKAAVGPIPIDKNPREILRYNANQLKIKPNITPSINVAVILITSTWFSSSIGGFTVDISTVEVLGF